jgi:hypothetical protein
VLVPILVAAGVTVQLFRPITPALTDRVFAEDGAIFLNGAVERGSGFFDVLLEPYAGYVHIVPRALAAVVAALPLDDAAAGFAVGSAIVVALLSVYVFVALADLIESHAIRAALALVMLVPPASGAHTAANASNLHWYFGFAAFCALISRPRGHAQVALATAVTALAALSDPLNALLIPLAVWQMLDMRGSRTRFVIIGGLAAGLLVQAGVGLGGSDLGGPTDHLSYDWFMTAQQAFLGRVGTAAIVGDRPLGGLVTVWGGWIYLATGVALAVLALAAIRRWPDRRSQVALVSIAYALGWFAVVVYLRGGTADAMSVSVGPFSTKAARYVLEPLLLLFLSAGAVVDRDRHAWPRWASVAAAVWLVSLVVHNYSIVATDREGDRAWSTELTAARTECMDGRQVATLRLAPGPPWAVTLDCRTILK